MTTADASAFVRQHPELNVITSSFLQFLLLHKPTDVFTFAAEHFASLKRSVSSSSAASITESKFQPRQDEWRTTGSVSFVWQPGCHPSREWRLFLSCRLFYETEINKSCVHWLSALTTSLYCGHAHYTPWIQISDTPAFIVNFFFLLEEAHHSTIVSSAPDAASATRVSSLFFQFYSLFEIHSLAVAQSSMLSSRFCLYYFACRPANAREIRGNHVNVSITLSLLFYSFLGLKLWATKWHELQLFVLFGTWQFNKFVGID